MPSALPRPGATWTLTTPSLPEAWAYPSAIATTAASWSASTYVSAGSSARPSMSGSSVVPGFPNMYCTPSCFRTSRKARLPDVSGMEVLRNAVMAPPSRRAGSVSGTAGSVRARPGHRELVAVRHRRPERGGPAEVLGGLGFPPLPPERGAEALMGPDRTRVELHRAREGGDGLARLSNVVEDRAEVEVALRP